MLLQVVCYTCMSQDSINLVLGGGFDELEPSIIYESMSQGTINIVFSEIYQFVDTCMQFTRGFFRYDTSFMDNALSLGSDKFNMKGLPSGSITMVCVPLSRALQVGRVYRVSYYLKASYISYYLTKYVGLRFFDTCVPMTAIVYEEFDTSWHADVGPDSVVGAEEWIKVEGEYCALGGERYVVASLWVPRDNRKVKELLLKFQRLYGKGYEREYIIENDDKYYNKHIRKRLFKEIGVKNPEFKPINKGRFQVCRMPDYITGGEEIYEVIDRINFTYLIDEIKVIPTDKSCMVKDKR